MSVKDYKILVENMTNEELIEEYKKIKKYICQMTIVEKEIFKRLKGIKK